MNKFIKTLISSVIVFAIIMIIALIAAPLGMSDAALGWIIIIVASGSSMALGCMFIAKNSNIYA